MANDTQDEKSVYYHGDDVVPLSNERLTGIRASFEKGKEEVFKRAPSFISGLIVGATLRYVFTTAVCAAACLTSPHLLVAVGVGAAVGSYMRYRADKENLSELDKINNPDWGRDAVVSGFIWGGAGSFLGWQVFQSLAPCVQEKVTPTVVNVINVTYNNITNVQAAVTNTLATNALCVGCCDSQNYISSSYAPCYDNVVSSRNGWWFHDEPPKYYDRPYDNPPHHQPTKYPTYHPTQHPTQHPTAHPTQHPTAHPTTSPTATHTSPPITTSTTTPVTTTTSPITTSTTVPETTVPVTTETTAPITTSTTVPETTVPVTTETTAPITTSTTVPETTVPVTTETTAPITTSTTVPETTVPVTTETTAPITTSTTVPETTVPVTTETTACPSSPQEPATPTIVQTIIETLVPTPA